MNAPTKKYYSNISPERGTLSIVIRTYKGVVTTWCMKSGFVNFKWQRNYYEHIVRSNRELRKIREYINNNPLKWELDRENAESKNFNKHHNSYWKGVYDYMGV